MDTFFYNNPVITANMAIKKISKKALWDEKMEVLKELYQAELDEPLETYFQKTPFRIIFIKKMPAVIKIKLINAFLSIYDTE